MTVAIREIVVSYDFQVRAIDAPNAEQEAIRAFNDVPGASRYEITDISAFLEPGGHYSGRSFIPPEWVVRIAAKNKERE